jgi:hypothetical protein
MENPNAPDNDNANTVLKETIEKLNNFASILEKFGLDIITKMGQTNLKINTLTDKVDELSRATIDVKALLPQLTNVIENQKILEEELDLIRTLIQRSDISFYTKDSESEIVDRDTSATDKKQSIVDDFNNLATYLNENDDPETVINKLEIIKEEIFVFTGGHRILYEIGQFNSKINGLTSLPGEIIQELKEKITFWINKLSVKG